MTLNIIFKYHMISAGKVMNLKVIELIKIYIFILIISLYDKVIITLFVKFTYLSYSFIL
jgi:hypothetical protein